MEWQAGKHKNIELKTAVVGYMLTSGFFLVLKCLFLGKHTIRLLVGVVISRQMLSKHDCKKGEKV